MPAQWEPQLNNSSGQTYPGCGTNGSPTTVLRPDLILCDRTAATPIIDVAEMKLNQTLGAGVAVAEPQMLAYRDELEAQGRAVRPLATTDPVLGQPHGDGGIDHFKIRIQDCGPANINYGVWYEFTTRAASDGVILVDNEEKEEQCGDDTEPPAAAHDHRQAV